VADTKENILQTALKLFARDGYEAVSVSEIAVELGMTKSALYKHYKNKRDIFDSIVQRLYEIDAERSREHNVPEKIFVEAPFLYQNISMENIKAFTEAQFRFWIEDDFSVNVRKMLSLERYRNPVMADLYQKVFVSGPINYMTDVFSEMMTEGLLEECYPKQLAIEFCAPFYLLLSLSDVSSNKMELSYLFETHIEKFMKDHFLERKN
jgi:AcrR family transcriptional regulator